MNKQNLSSDLALIVFNDCFAYPGLVCILKVFDMCNICPCSVLTKSIGSMIGLIF